MYAFMPFLVGIALAVTALDTPLESRSTFSTVATGFDKYCTWLEPFDQDGNALRYMASCATSGLYDLGAALSQSTLDINKCLANDNGVIAGRANGGALGSCDCAFGTHVCGYNGDCATTTGQCSCKTKTGAKHTNNFDIADYIGVGFDKQNHLVLYCYGIYGDYDQCTSNGAGASCPAS